LLAQNQMAFYWIHAIGIQHVYCWFGGQVIPGIKFLLFAALLIAGQASAQDTAKPDALGNHIQGELSFLADDALKGRGSGTAYELVAAVYLASQLRELGIQPAGDHGGYIQNISG